MKSSNYKAVDCNGFEEVCWVSALTGDGVSDLRKVIEQWLAANAVLSTDGGIENSRQYTLLSKASNEIHLAIEKSGLRCRNGSLCFSFEGIIRLYSKFVRQAV